MTGLGIRRMLTMNHYDGCSEIQPEKNSISLIQIGHLDPELFTKIHAGLQSFVTFVSGTDIKPIVTTDSFCEPNFPVKQYSGWGTAYSSLLSNANLGPITIGITMQGLWETLPEPRFIFCSIVGPGTVVLSLYRFQRMNTNRLARIQKEVIKGLGMALGIGQCNDHSCIQSYHWYDKDFDRNTGVCESCVKSIKVRFRQCFDDKTSNEHENFRQNCGVIR
jgi:hypothetical protein